jgi:membrane protein
MDLRDPTDDGPKSGSGFVARIQIRIDALSRRWPWFGGTLDVLHRYSELHGDNLAAAVTLVTFLSLFPLLLVGIAVLGFFTAHSPNLAGDLVARLGLSGEAAKTFTNAMTTAQHSRRTASIIGLGGLIWAGLGVVGALQYGYNQVWQVASRGWRDRLVGIVWLAGAGVIVAASAGMTAALRYIPGFLTPVGFVVAFAVDVALWMWTSHTLPNRDVGWRPLLPGALLGATGFEILKLGGAYFVPRAVASASALYGSIGIIFAVMAWLLLFGKLIIYSEVLNVVLYERRVGVDRATIEMPRLDGRYPGETTRTGQREVAETLR